MLTNNVHMISIRETLGLAAELEIPMEMCDSDGEIDSTTKQLFSKDKFLMKNQLASSPRNKLRAFEVDKRPSSQPPSFNQRKGTDF